MPCIPIKGGVICLAGPFYHFKGFYFEARKYVGPLKINKGGEPAKREGKKFLAAMDEWYALPLEERDKYRVEG